MWHTNMDNMSYIWHIKPIPNAHIQSQIGAAVLMHQQQGLSQYDFAQV